MHKMAVVELLLRRNNIGCHNFFMICSGIFRGAKNLHIHETDIPEFLEKSPAFLGSCNSGKPVVKITYVLGRYGFNENHFCRIDLPAFLDNP